MAETSRQALPARIVEQAWERYRAATVPSDATELEVEHARICFLSGAVAVFNTIVRAAAGPAASDEELAELLFTIGAELQEIGPHA